MVVNYIRQVRRRFNGIPYVVVHGRDNNSTDHQEPVGHGYVDLFVEPLARVDDLDVWKVRQTHYLD
jgi:hypothetical protein